MQGLAAIKAGLDLLQKGLPQLPMGSKVHTSVLKAISDIGKHLAEEGGEHGGKDVSAVVQELVNAARAAKLNPGGAGAPGGPPPGMPPMGSAPMGGPPGGGM